MSQDLNSSLECAARALALGPLWQGFTLDSGFCQVGKIKPVKCPPAPGRESSWVIQDDLREDFRYMAIDRPFYSYEEAEQACEDSNADVGMIKDSKDLAIVHGSFYLLDFLMILYPRAAFLLSLIHI